MFTSISSTSPGQVDSSETLTHYLFKGEYGNGHVKHRALQPPLGGVLSAFRVDGLMEGDIWDIASRHVETTSGRPIMARADFDAGSVRMLGLEVIPAEPPVRHAHLTNWPDKAAIVSIAQQLAASAMLRVRTPAGA